MDLGSGRLIRSGRFREALAALRLATPRDAQTVRYRAELAAVLQVVGHSAEAEGLARGILSARRTDRCYTVAAHEVLGLTALDCGDVQRATRSFSDALAVAQESYSESDCFRLRLRLLNTFAECTDKATVDSEIASLNDIAVRLADTHLHAMLHLKAGGIAAKKGNVDLALSHLGRGFRFLEMEPNAVIEGQLALDTSISYSLLSDYQAAHAHALRAFEAATLSGHLRTLAASLANLAEYSLQLDRLNETEAHISAGLQYAAQFPSIELALLDAKACLLYRLGRAAEALELIRSLSRERAGELLSRNAWLSLSVRDTEAGLLESLGKHSEAIGLLLEALSSTKSQLVQPFEVDLTLRACQLLVTQGRLSEAGDLLDALLSRQPSLSPSRAKVVTDLVGQICGLETLGHEWPNLPLELLAALNARETSPVPIGELLVRTLHNTGGPRAELIRGGSQHSQGRSGWTDGTDFYLGEHEGVEVALRVRAPTRLPERLATAYIGEFLKVRSRVLGETEIAGRASPREQESTSVAMCEVWTLVDRIASSDVTVLVTGETGVGKEYVARRIHNLSNRAGQPFLPYNCTSVPREMLESQMFGYRKGAFTGASDGFSGVIRSSDRGTLFLDEFGDLSLELQPKFLRFLETGEVHPLGEPTPVRVNTRVIVATNVDLEQSVEAGAFRKDLYYRICSLRLQVPPLRQRREEILPLARRFLEAAAQDTDGASLVLSPEAADLLLIYAWPGNIRELQNVMRRCAILARGESQVLIGHLPPEIRGRSGSTFPLNLSVGGEASTLEAAVEQLERTLIVQTMEAAGGRVEEAARRLGLSRKGLFLKRKRLGLD